MAEHVGKIPVSPKVDPDNHWPNWLVEAVLNELPEESRGDFLERMHRRGWISTEQAAAFFLMYRLTLS